MNHPVVAVFWLVCCCSVGWIGYRRIAWQLGHRPAGRFLANTVAMTAYLLGLSGVAILWPSLLEGNTRYVGTESAAWWTWSRAFAAAGGLGILSGAMLTWMRRLETYRYEAAGLRPWLDDAAREMKADAEGEADAQTCRALAAELRAEAERRRQPLPPDLQQFVERYTERDKIST